MIPLGQAPSADPVVELAERNLRALADPEHQARAAAWREARDREERWHRQGFEADERRRGRA